jgi:hypothetical protein
MYTSIRNGGRSGKREVGVAKKRVPHMVEPSMRHVEGMARLLMRFLGFRCDSFHEILIDREGVFSSISTK